MFRYKNCPKGIQGDIQLETILTPLLFPRTKPGKGELWVGSPIDTQPKLKILDVGCGWGRLLAGLMSFPPHLTKNIEYFGVESSVSEKEFSLKRIADLERVFPGNKKFSDVISKIDFGIWDDFKDLKSEFDYVYLVNVLHHLPPTMIPTIFKNINRLVKGGGYLIIHDFYFHNPSDKYDLSKYCPNSIFFGPNHLSSFFTMASSQTGIYRTMRRKTEKGIYDLFTFILHFENELAEPLSVNDDFFSHEYMPVGIDASLDDIISRCSSLLKNEWFLNYVGYLKESKVQLNKNWHLLYKTEQSRSVSKWINSIY
ncbi:class I SAM-dependent methyltransferase [Seonamhaeicola sp.]|uniref:SAM-dependent methyltransferase n=1 Tax=Seonamhaeicola sp. TaxID=1912245 RepID=UPI002629BA0A|nr:class I SAM-dependent methyltransferase [Seonamhaeicola sp.]